MSPSRLFFTPINWDAPQTVTVYAGVDFDAEPDTATLTHTLRGGDYTGVPAESVEVTVDRRRQLRIEVYSLAQQNPDHRRRRTRYLYD